MRHRDRNGNHNGKLHYKMYKAGGKWTFCGIVLVSVATASLLNTHSVYAASQPSTQSSQPLQGNPSTGSSSPSKSEDSTQQYITGAQPPKLSPATATPAVTPTDVQVKQPILRIHLTPMETPTLTATMTIPSRLPTMLVANKVALPSKTKSILDKASIFRVKLT